MTRAQALAELISKVESGDIPDTGVDRFSAIPKRGGGVYADPNWYDANAAYWRNDLNAALALHQAVLPGGLWAGSNAGSDCDGPLYMVAKVKDGLVDYRDKFEASADTPARAWLLAILKALHAQEQEMTQ